MTNQSCLIIMKKRHACPNCGTKVGFFYKQNFGLFPRYCKNCGVHLFIEYPFILVGVSVFLIASGVAIFFVSSQVVSVILVIFGFLASIVIRIFAPLKIKPQSEKSK